MFFPSCKIKAAFPEESARLADYLEKRFGIAKTDCCRINRTKLTEKDTAIVVCHTCAAILEESSLASQILYAWELIDRDADFPFPDYQGECITLQDCYMARERTHLHEVVRSLLKKMNFKVVELEHNRNEANFCGLRTLEPLADNQRLAPKHYCLPEAFTPLVAEESANFLKQYVAQYKTKLTVAYCGACRKAMIQGGAQTVHLLELLFPNDHSLLTYKRKVSFSFLK